MHIIARWDKFATRQSELRGKLHWLDKIGKKVTLISNNEEKGWAVHYSRQADPPVRASIDRMRQLVPCGVAAICHIYPDVVTDRPGIPRIPTVFPVPER